jgi:low temperature requirement protein LtrA
VTGVSEEVAQAVPRGRRTSSVELRSDLVFAFAVTQVITLLPRDSYIHFVIVAGIIVFAVGAKLVIGGTGPGGLALFGSVAAYLIGQEGFPWRMLGVLEPWRLAVAITLVALCPVADQLPVGRPRRLWRSRPACAPSDCPRDARLRPTWTCRQRPPRFSSGWSASTR